MPTLIDGYNLMHAIGLARPQMRPRDFERNRERLLVWLLEKVADPAELLVIFDAQNAPRHGTQEVVRQGIRVQFAHRESADDRIEDLLARELNPRAWVVVSNDTRLQQSARRRGAKFQTCNEFLDTLTDDRSSPLPDPEPEFFDEAANSERRDGVPLLSDEENQQLLQIFQTLPSPRQRQRR